MRRAASGEREQLGRLFAELCAIESPFRHERLIVERVAAELRELGLEPELDDAGAAVGSDAPGNVFARIPGTGERSILLCAHLDTVPLTAPVEPVVVDGGWENANEGILGADNKVAVAVMLAAARRLAREPAPVGVELLFTLCEENALAGAKQFDTGRLRSDFGYVFDHASPIGEIVVASPTYHRIVAEFRGRAAHAGVRPEAGRSAIAAAARAVAAMELGRLDEQTTANVGTIHGGSGTNVIPALCTIEAEARSLDDDRVEAVVGTMIDHLTDAANAGEVDVDVSVERLFQGYRTRPGAPQVRAAEEALRRCGYEPRHIVTGGGSDANALAVAGFPCTNLADGTERNHEPTERIAVASLEAMLDITYELVETAAAVDGEPC